VTRFGERIKGRTGMKPLAYVSWAATLSMPAWEQSSSLPGDPDTATAPTTSSPTLIGSPPDSASTLLVARLSRLVLVVI
jgi:hypothetical protein